MSIPTLNSMVSGFIVVGAMELVLLAAKDNLAKIKAKTRSKRMGRTLLFVFVLAEAVVFYQGIKIIRISESPAFQTMTMTVDK